MSVSTHQLQCSLDMMHDTPNGIWRDRDQTICPCIPRRGFFDNTGPLSWCYLGYAENAALRGRQHARAYYITSSATTELRRQQHFLKSTFKLAGPAGACSALLRPTRPSLLARHTKYFHGSSTLCRRRCPTMRKKRDQENQNQRRRMKKMRSADLSEKSTAWQSLGTVSCL